MMSDTIWVAIIGAAATICAAVIAVYARVASNPQERRRIQRRRQKKVRQSDTEVPILSPMPVPVAAPRFPTKEIKPLEMLKAWVGSERSAPWYLPIGLHNVEIRFLIERLALGLRCDDKALGLFRVIGVDAGLQEVLHLEGANNQDAVPEVGLNQLDLTDELLRVLFHAARCKREHKRTGDIAYLKGYEDFRRRADAILGRTPV